VSGPGFGYFLGKALRNFSRNVVVNGICVATIAIAFYILSVTQLAFWNFSAAAERAARANRLIVYIKDSALPMDVERLLKTLREQPGVAEAMYTSKEKALSDFRRSLGVQSVILEGLDFNPLPASIDVVLQRWAAGLETVEALSAQVATMDGVDSVNFGKELFAKMEKIRRILGRLDAGITVLMVLAVIFIVANTIRLNIYSRREEIEVQQLVGGSDLFIRAPFLIEGALQGFFGGLIAEGLLVATYMLATGAGGAVFSTPFGVITPSFMPGWASSVLILSSSMLGAAGSWLALGRYMKRFIQHEV
jgi:cell division transport system permease protein